MTITELLSLLCQLKGRSCSQVEEGLVDFASCCPSAFGPGSAGDVVAGEEVLPDRYIAELTNCKQSSRLCLDNDAAFGAALLDSPGRLPEVSVGGPRLAGRMSTPDL